MKQFHLRQCLDITSDLAKQPICSFFSVQFSGMSVDHNLNQETNRGNIFYQILQKLRNNSYESPVEWHNEITQMFQNVMEIFPKGSAMNALTDYLQQNFEKKCRYLFMSYNQWNQQLRQLMIKLNDITESSPIPQAVDPFVTDLSRFSSQYLNVPHDLFSSIAYGLNELLKIPQRKEEIFNILQQNSIDLKADLSRTTDIQLTFNQLRGTKIANTLALYMTSHLSDLPPNFASMMSRIQGKTPVNTFPTRTKDYYQNHRPMPIPVPSILPQISNSTPQQNYNQSASSVALDSSIKQQPNDSTITNNITQAEPTKLTIKPALISPTSQEHQVELANQVIQPGTQNFTEQHITNVASIQSPNQNQQQELSTQDKAELHTLVYYKILCYIYLNF